MSVQVEAGGFLDVINLDTNITTRHYYTGPPTVRGAVFVLDFQPPSHCSLPPLSCSAEDQPLLSVGGDIITTPNITTQWGGWRDTPSGVNGYVLSVHHLEESGGQLLEGARLETVAYNESGEVVYEASFELPVEGAYSILLQTLDNAGNIRYSRRLVLYDRSSTLNIDPTSPLTVTSALPQTNYRWQNSTQEPIVVSGVGHFYNSLLQFRDLLAPVGDSFNGSLAEDYDHPLTEGRYPRRGTTNALGVVRLRYDYSIDQEGGQSLSFPDVLRFESRDDVGIQDISITPDLQDGDSVRVWFLASDYNTQEINDSVLVHVDSSSPLLVGLGLVRNGVGGLSLHASDALTDMIIEFDAQDRHSGLISLEWRIGTGPGLADVGSGDVPIEVVAMDTCEPPECVCSPLGACSRVRHAFSPRLSDLSSSPANHDAEYHITITATNHALLSAQVSLVFTVDAMPPLPGVVLDGPGGMDAQAELDYQADNTLQGAWSGFFDRESDIMFYEYVFDSECANNSVFTYPLDPDSIVMATDTTSASTQAQGEEELIQAKIMYLWNLELLYDKFFIHRTKLIIVDLVVHNFVLCSPLSEVISYRVMYIQWFF